MIGLVVVFVSRKTKELLFFVCEFLGLANVAGRECSRHIRPNVEKVEKISSVHLSEETLSL